MNKFRLLMALSLLPAAIILNPSASWSQGDRDPKLIEAAKKEGRVIWFTSMTLDQSKQVSDRFWKKYPFIEPTVVRSGGGVLLNKILAESQVGIRTWDVVVGRAEMVLPLMESKLLARYRSPEAKMIEDDQGDLSLTQQGG